MKPACIFLLMIFAWQGSGCLSGKSGNVNQDVLPAKQLEVYGRFVADQNRVELVSSAAHFGFRFSGDSCRIHVSLSPGWPHNYLQYELDGKYQKRIRIEKDQRGPLTLYAGKGEHTIWIYKATEAHTGPVYIEKIEAEGIRPLRKPSLPLIEFIGNSITCGAAADDSEIPCGQGAYHDQHNAYFSYAPRLARALQADFILSSVSGIGIYRNWNSNGPAMPAVYEKTDFQEKGERFWDFGRRSPAIISMALGTNDFSDGDGLQPRAAFDSAVFVEAYAGFIKTIKSKYPGAIIALLGSPMLNGKKRTQLHHCINAVKNHIDRSFPKDLPVAVYFFSPMKPGGCTGHPDLDDHELMAQELLPFFKNLLSGP